MATAVLMIGVRPRKVVLCCKKMVRWGLGCRDKRGLQGLQAATCRRMKRGCGGRERGRCVGPENQNPPGLCFSGHCTATLQRQRADTTLLVWASEPKKRKESGEDGRLCCRAGAGRSAYSSKNG